jgi:hypothetical protein
MIGEALQAAPRPGDGDGTFQAPRNYATGWAPQSVAVGDFNADGRLDLVVANGVSNNISVFLGNADGSFETARNFGTARDGPASVAVGDFNGDGLPDLASTVSVLINNTYQRKSKAP